MPVHREKPPERERKQVSTLEPSVSRKIKREESVDKRPVVTQEKPSKPKTDKAVKKDATTSKDKAKTQIDHARAADKRRVLERQRTVDSPKNENKIKREVKKDVTTMKDVLKKKSLVKESSADDVKKPSNRTRDREVLQKQIARQTTKEEQSLNGRTKKTSSKVKDGDLLGKSSQRQKTEAKSVPDVPRGPSSSRGRQSKAKDGSTKSSKKDRERTRTHTLSPTEVKVLHMARPAEVEAKGISQMSDDYMKAFGTSSGQECGEGDRVRQAVAEDEAGAVGEYGDGKDKEDDENQGDVDVDVDDDEEEEEDYEDDFEDYESDFEDDSEANEDESNEVQKPEPAPAEAEESISSSFSSHDKRTSKLRVEESEKKLDSGSYDMKPAFHRKEIEEIKLALKKEELQVAARRNGGNLTDEGYSEEPEQKPVKSEPQMINFSSARKRRLEQEVSAKAKKRGEELLSMITLDAITYSLFEIPATPYEAYMKTYGRSNTLQVHVQTNEDDLDEETQTDTIAVVNKWTQKPVEFVSVRKESDQPSYVPLKEERLGVGGDVPVLVESSRNHIIDTNRLNDFLTIAGQMILACLEYESGNCLSLDKMANHSDKISFGDGFVSLNVSDVTFLKGRPVPTVSFLSRSANNMLSVHEASPESRCMICVWSLQEPSKPLKILVCCNAVTSCSFGPHNGNLVFAGLRDGSVCVWDLREPSSFHEATTEGDWTLRSPTYSTAEILKEQGHQSAIVSLKSLINEEELSSNLDFTPIQLCSVEECGTIIIWTVTQSRNTQRTTPNDDLGLAHWGKVKLVKSFSFSIFDHLRDELAGIHVTCNDLAMNDAEENGLFVTSSLGRVHHCSTYGSYMKPKFYTNNKQDAFVETTCLEMCPFDTNYFLVGCGDGSIRLHTRHQETPLICLNGNVIENGPEAAIVSLTWLHTRPCVFFALDSLSRIHIWDLGVSDMYPEVSLVLTKYNITSMKLTSSNQKQTPCIVLTTASGSIEIHRLNKDYGSRSQQDIHKEMKMFLRYVSIL